MSDTIEKLNEGDVFRWNYRDPDADNHQYDGRYHCCSRIAIVRNGRLRDTYWMIGDSFASDGTRTFGIDDLSRIALTHLGNMADLEKVPEYQSDYYADADIVDLNHANSSRGNFYLRKGAVRSQAKMLVVAKYKLEQSESAERSEALKSERLREAIAKIESGDTSVYL
jgi:hypothetical protein